MIKKVTASLGLLAIFVLGTVQLATPALAIPPDCAAVLCLPCPEGTIAAPTKGNCCRCVRVGRP